MLNCTASILKYIHYIFNKIREMGRVGLEGHLQRILHIVIKINSLILLSCSSQEVIT